MLLGDLLAVSANSISRLLFQLSSSHKYEEASLFIIESGRYPIGFKWIEEGKEFSLNNKFYDIKNIRVNKNIIRITAVSDKKEDLLNKAVASDSKERKKSHINSNHYSISKYIQPTVVLNTPEISNVEYCYAEFNLLSAADRTFSPPPEFFS